MGGSWSGGIGIDHDSIGGSRDPVSSGIPMPSCSARASESPRSGGSRPTSIPASPAPSPSWPCRSSTSATTRGVSAGLS